VLSLFEPHTALICRGKAKPKETEFGRKVWYAEVEGGLIAEYRLLKGNPDEAPLLLPSLPQPGYKSDQRRNHEREPWFRAAQRFRNGIEGRISQLRRARHLDRCLA
jgi:IS5 family transposase